jgi:hypothetical protein
MSDDTPPCPTCGEDSLDERPNVYGPGWWCESCKSYKEVGE